MAPRTRDHRPERVAAALAVQWTRVTSYLAGIEDDRLAREPVPPGRRIGDPVAELARNARVLALALAAPEPVARPDRDAIGWVRGGLADVSYATDATDVADPSARTAGLTAEQAFATARAALDEAGWPERSPRRLVRLDGAVSTVTDLAVGLVADAVIRADDLARSLGDAAFPHDRQALAITVRVLADALAAGVPGHSVELRVPPFVAVQCVPGPRHTRGTPPSVVQTDPITWTRLAAGRLSWAEALAGGSLAASGERSDLTAYLPLVGRPAAAGPTPGNPAGDVP